MAYGRFWQLRPHFVTAMLTALSYSSLNAYCANTKLKLFILLIDLLIVCKAINSKYAARNLHL